MNGRLLRGNGSQQSSTQTVEVPRPAPQTLVHETTDEPFYHDVLNDDLFHVPADVGKPEDKNFSYPDELGWGGYPPPPDEESFYEEEEDEEDASSKAPGIQKARVRRMALGARQKPAFVQASHSPSSSRDKDNEAPARQWLVGSDGVYRPTGETVPSLPPGVYMTGCDFSGCFLKAHTVLTDDLVALPDGPSHAIYESISKFWDSKASYQKHGLLFKRGILLYGPPGTGKTASLNLVAQDLISRGGLVIFCDSAVSTFIHLIHAVRSTEPERPIIAVMEDIDTIVNSYTENDMIALLDGEQKIGNLVVVATTNFIERLGARIVNRPSRFDKRIKVDMPTAKDRAFYLAHVTKGEVEEDTIQKWARDTEGMSLAHLKELAIAVVILGNDYISTLQDLKGMYTKPTDDQDGFWK